MTTASEPVGPDAIGPAPPARPRRWRRRLVRWAVAAVVIYLGVCLVLAALQTSIIFPGAATQGQPGAIVRPMPGRELLELHTPDGQRVAAIFGRALTADGRDHPDAASRPTILFFYGNGMCMADAVPIFQDLRRLGANVIVADFLGYGMSGGAPSEAGCYATADAVLAHVRSRPDVDHSKIIAMGWSLGAAAAIDLAAREPVAGLVAMSAFTSTRDMAALLLPPVFPLDLLVRHRFENERKIAGIRCPILIAHGVRDSIIPSGMSDRLAAAAGPRLVANLRFDEADHNDFFDAGGDELTAGLQAFVDRVAAGEGGGGGG